MTEFNYEAMFQFGADDTEYRKLDIDGVRLEKFAGQDMLVVEPKALEALSAEAFRDVSHLLRTRHLQSLANILEDPEASKNDCLVARELLKNAVIAAQFVLPSCQDTGTAIVMGKKGQRVWTGGGDAAALSAGIWKRYQESNLRYSQVAPLKMYDEKNTKSNLPAQIDLLSTDG